MRPYQRRDHKKGFHAWNHNTLDSIYDVGSLLYSQAHGKRELRHDYSLFVLAS